MSDPILSEPTLSDPTLTASPEPAPLPQMEAEMDGFDTLLGDGLRSLPIVPPVTPDFDTRLNRELHAGHDFRNWGAQALTRLRWMLLPAIVGGLLTLLLAGEWAAHYPHASEADTQPAGMYPTGTILTDPKPPPLLPLPIRLQPDFVPPAPQPPAATRHSQRATPSGTVWRGQADNKTPVR